MTRLALCALLCAPIFGVLAACGGEVDPIPPDLVPVFQEEVDAELVVRVRRNAMEYLDAQIEAPEGSTVRIVVDNTETTSPAMVHNVVVLQSDAAINRVGAAATGSPGNIPEDPAIIFYTPQAQPRTKTAVVVTMPAAGEYPFICTYPGHFQTMQGRLVSTPAG